MSRFTPFLLVGLLLAPGCGDSPEAVKAKKEAGEAVDAFGELAAKKRDDWTAAIKESLSGYDDDIQALKEAAKAKGGELSADAKQVIATLEEKAGDARVKLSELAENKGEVWEKMKGSADSSLDELKKAIADAKEKLK